MIVRLVSIKTFKVTERWNEGNIFLLSRGLPSPSWPSNINFITLFSMFYLHVLQSKIVNKEPEFYGKFMRRIPFVQIIKSIKVRTAVFLFQAFVEKKFIIIKNNLPTEYALTKYKYIFLTIILLKVKYSYNRRYRSVLETWTNRRLGISVVRPTRDWVRTCASIIRSSSVPKKRTVISANI